MPPEYLRLAAFWVYLGTWVALGVLALVLALPGHRTGVPIRITVPSVAGMLLQAASALPITLSLKEGPLRPGFFEVAATLALAPLTAVLFGWIVLSAGRDSGPTTLVTWGPYAWLRHPMYLAFLAMLVATGLIASAGVKLVAAIALYVLGSELRIAAEEHELEESFPGEYARYRLRTRWRYLPGIR
jgi:protein-S-isoprenylcysteine O-methyltransferase Ste14